MITEGHVTFPLLLPHPLILKGHVTFILKVPPSNDYRKTSYIINPHPSYIPDYGRISYISPPPATPLRTRYVSIPAATL